MNAPALIDALARVAEAAARDALDSLGDDPTLRRSRALTAALDEVRLFAPVESAGLHPSQVADAVSTGVLRALDPDRVRLERWLAHLSSTAPHLD